MKLSEKLRSAGGSIDGRVDLADHAEALEAVAEAANWLDHLNHGAGKAGGPPEQGEWDNAYDALHSALDRLQELSDEQ